MEKVKKVKKFTNSGMVAHFLKGCRLMFAFSMFCGLVVTFISVVIPQVISFAVDSVIGSKPPEGVFLWFSGLFGGAEAVRGKLWVPALAVAVLALAMAAFQYCMLYFNHRANQSLMRGMRNGLFRHIQRLPAGWHAKHSTGDIIQRCTSDADAISNFVSNQLTSLARIVILLVLSLALMFAMNVELALIAAAFIPLLVGYSLFFYARAGKSFRKCDEEEGVLSSLAQENLTGVRVVRAFGRERYERDRFEKQNVYYTGLWVRIERFLAAYWTTNDFLAALQCMLLIVVGTLFCLEGRISAGDLVAFISYNTMLMGPVRQLGRIISGMSRAGVSVGRIAEIMNADEEEYGEAGALSGDIEFKDVSFCYEEGKPVLEGVSFTVPQGSTLGIIGGTGSGKSTLMYLLDGLYAPTQGNILIGGKDISQIPNATLRANIGFVLQEGYLYTGTVRENIAAAAEDAGEQEIRGAAAAACVDENISSFAAGYDTVVGERGVTLSGGQKQRVSIARTLLRKTPYLIFDDSLSAVDSDTDAAIRARLIKQYGGCTVIMISHRVTTVMNADNIIVMEGGRIAEQGTHAQLLRQDGIYKRIFGLQADLAEELASSPKAAQKSGGAQEESAGGGK